MKNFASKPSFCGRHMHTLKRASLLITEGLFKK
jgi:hypothetical protein